MSFNSETAAQAGRISSREGKPNKNTAEVRELFKELLEANLEKLNEDIQNLKPAERVKAIIDIARFVLPTLKATELKVEGSFPPILISLSNGQDKN